MTEHELIEILKMYKGEPSELCEKPIPHGFDLNDETVDSLIEVLKKEERNKEYGKN